MPAEVDLVVAEATAVASDVVRLHETTAAVAYAHIFTDPFPRDEAEARWTSYPGIIVLAVADGAAVGFAACKDDLPYALYVLPEHAGKGTGSRLLAAVPQVRRLWVLESNKRGRRFYEKRGWLVTSEVRAAYGDVMEVLYRRPPLASQPPR